MEDHNLKRKYTAIITVRKVVPMVLKAKYKLEPDSLTVAEYFIRQHIKFELMLRSEKTGTILALLPDVKYHK